MAASRSKSNGITRSYYRVTYADGTQGPMKKAFHVQHSNPFKKLYYILRERLRD